MTQKSERTFDAQDDVVTFEDARLLCDTGRSCLLGIKRGNVQGGLVKQVICALVIGIPAWLFRLSGGSRGVNDQQASKKSGWE